MLTSTTASCIVAAKAWLAKGAAAGSCLTASATLPHHWQLSGFQRRVACYLIPFVVTASTEGPAFATSATSSCSFAPTVETAS